MDRQSIGGGFIGRGITSPRKRMSMAQSLKRQSSVPSISGRSNQSVQIICRSANHIVESFGSSLPVLVKEALTFIDPNTSVSVSLSETGWAWLVCGRRLLVWQCKTTIHDPKQRPSFKSQCRELILPQSDLAHKADCIAVWLPQGHQVPCCMAVSPEGIVRYWASVAQEETSVETSAELAGQEVDCLTHVPGHGCILATTTCTVALLQPQFNNGRNIINCRVLRSQGWLSDIGRRMSSIFRAIPQSQPVETKLAKVICTTINNKDSRVLILAGSSLQYWSFPNGDIEKMEFDKDIGTIISQAFQRRIFESPVINQQNLETWPIDMQVCDEGIILLVAAHITDISRKISFAIGLLSLDGTTLSNTFTWFTQVKIDYFTYQNDNVYDLSEFRFIYCGWEAIIYDSSTLLVVNTTNEYEQDQINLIRGNEDAILGGSLCSGTPVLFTKNLGLVTITQSDFTSHDFNNSIADVNNSLCDYNNTNDNNYNYTTTTITNDKLKEMYFSNEGIEQLTAAFVYSLKQKRSECEQILNELFPYQEEPIMDIDANLDTLVLKVGRKLIDDCPANDPRWANHMDTSMTMTTVNSVQIQHQLEGKLKSLDHYVTFLKEYNLWDRFCAVSYRGIIMSTSYVLGEYAEKIIAALAIFNLQNRYPDILDEIIKKSLNQDTIISDSLTSKDIFYREVSTIHNILPYLVNTVNDMTQTEMPTPQISQYILRVNTIILGILHEVIKYRQNNADRYVPSKTLNAITEYLPWTAASGKQDLKTSLYTMQKLTLKYGVNGTNDATIKRELYDQIVGLIDLILDGRKCHLESIRGTDKFDILLKKYETERTNLIQPLIKHQHYENAAMLAEKYCDFATLVQICELTDNKKLLDSYTEKFSNQDFVGFLFSWYVKGGKQGQLVERCRRGGATELTEKLAEHPELSWLQASLTNEYRLAANTLHSLATQEVELVKRKKTMLSMSKLALLCLTDIDNEFEETLAAIDSDLELIGHQESLPDSVLEAYGYDTKKLRVLNPIELITLYTCEENTLANEFDFKKSLDLLEYITINDEKESLRLRIWARAAKKNKWDIVVKNPDKEISQTLIFKLISLYHMMGVDFDYFLPPIDELMNEPELGELKASSNFQYLIKLVYEHTSQLYQL
ncbi:hypothetical protein HCN44_002078 [Aphidius gifuensis]|uniref:Nucleoporin Nup133/Nup155-like N-terminal domain-containing protein n=1 Tax=Aphidius gifuensis TaxID=684658 RepID=A0A834Y0P4_APHGI|nr:nuclear pore complex protein Nup133 [Aphidius gifuensis]KAF7996446.1 hypothetical protein HCN44_002078 [Aphidius gifuensis]